MHIKFYSGLVALNLFIWLVVFYSSRPDTQPNQLIQEKCIENPATMVDVKQNISTPKVANRTGPSITGKTEFTDKQPEQKSLLESNLTQPGENELAVPDHYLPEDISIQGNQELELSKDGFAYDAVEQKIVTISKLTNNGEDLAFLSRVLTSSDESAEVKVAAIQQIRGADSYGAISTLVAALEDSSENVAANALMVLQASGDDSLLPIIKNKREALPEGGLKSLYTETIESMESTIVVEMDSD